MPCRNSICPFQYAQNSGYLLSAPAGEERCIVAGAARLVKFRKGQNLFVQGQLSTSLYSLSSGMVKIVDHGADKREQIIGLSHPGKPLVGLQSITEDRYAYSAIAATPVQACQVDHNKLLELVWKRGDVAMSLIGALRAQLKYSRALMEVLGHKFASAKIASLILLMIPKSQHNNKEFSLPFSRLEIAHLLNLSEETVCRHMADMQRSGVIEAPRQIVTVLSWSRLRQIADGVDKEIQH